MKIKTLTKRQDKKKLEELFAKAALHEKVNKINRIYDKGKLNRILRKIGYRIECYIPLNFNNKCRFCKKEPIDSVITKSYWWSLWSICCKGCKQKGEVEESYECQKIDSDCNDCLYFVRLKGAVGTCRKFNKEVVASPNFASGFDCFKHRKEL
jgi:hypothetical protein